MFGVDKPQNVPDTRIAKLLDLLEIEYELEECGDFKVTFALENGRTHIAMIRSQTYEFSDVEMRHIYSPALHSFGAFDQRTANLLLRANTQAKIGGWSVALDNEDNSIAIFVAAVSAELEPEQLAHVLSAVATTADEMEERLTGRDDY